MGKIGTFVIDIMIAIIFFFAVTIYFGIRTETVMRTLGTELSDEFMNDTKMNGYITVQDYEAFMKKLSFTNALYDVTFWHTFTTYEPEYRQRTPEEVIEEQNKLYTGANIYTYTPVSTTIPTVNDPVNNAALNTETNASVLASAVNTPASPSHVHADTCYLGHYHSAACGNNRQYYTGAMPFHLNGSSYTGTYSYFTRSIVKTLYCNYNHEMAVAIMTDHEYDGITHLFAGDTITLCQKYLDSNNVIQTEYKDAVPMYLQSNTYQPGWTAVSDGTVTFYRKLNPEWDAYASNFYNSVNADNTANLWAWVGMGVKTTYSCPECLRTGAISKSLYQEWGCGLTQDATVDCGNIIVSIVATHPTQTVATGDPLITTVRASYLDGSIKVVEATTTYSTAVVAQKQTAVLNYNYNIDGTAFNKTCSIQVSVIPRTKTCSRGHTYNMNSDGSDPGCPYCRSWIDCLKVIAPVSSPVVITIGTTLQENGVKVLVIYLDGHAETLTSGYVNNLDRKYLGTQQVTIGYKGAATQLMVKSVCAKMTCTICGYVYDLYPDGTDPGCPRCIAKIPVFTGNVMTYDNCEYTQAVLEKLYQDGKYEFHKGDKFTIRITNKTSAIGRKILSRIYPSLTDRWFSYTNKETIKVN